MPWYWGDWFKAPDVRSLPRETRCVWFEMLGLMWESNERGYLTINGKPMSDFAKASALGFGSDVAAYMKHEDILEDLGIFSNREKDGAIYCRKILKDLELRTKRQQAGSKGGYSNAKRFGKANGIANPENETETKRAIKKKKKVKHSFDISPYFDKKVFQEKLGVDIHEAAFWWHGLNDYSQQDNKYFNWLVTARTWKRLAEAKGDNRHKTYRLPKKVIPSPGVKPIEKMEEEMGPPEGFIMPEILAKKVPKNDESVFEKKKRFLKQGG